MAVRKVQIKLDRQIFQTFDDYRASFEARAALGDDPSVAGGGEDELTQVLDVALSQNRPPLGGDSETEPRRRSRPKTKASRAAR